MSVNPTVSDMLRPTQTGGDGDPTITMSVNPTVSDMLRPTQTSGTTIVLLFHFHCSSHWQPRYSPVFL